MKKLLAILAAAVTAAVLMAGCSTPASAATTPTPAGTSTDISATATDNTDNIDPESEMVAVGDWQYYLQRNDPITADTGEPPPLHRQKLDGSNDTDLGVRGDDFEVYGNFIYLDTYVQDENQSLYASTVRLNLDGTNPKKLEYSDMKRFVPDGSTTMYFTAGGDSVIYVSDLGCENVQTINIVLPDKAEIESKIGANYTTSIDLSDVANGVVNYVVTLKNSAGIDLYYGIYYTTLDGKTTTKEEGNFVDLGEQDGTAPETSSAQ